MEADFGVDTMVEDCSSQLDGLCDLRPRILVIDTCRGPGLRLLALALVVSPTKHARRGRVSGLS